MATKRIKDLNTSITAFRTGDYIAVDGPSGTAKMSKYDLLKETSGDALNLSARPFSQLDAVYGFASGEFSFDLDGTITYLKDNGYNGRWKQILVDSNEVEFNLTSSVDFVVLASAGNYRAIAVAVKGSNVDYLFEFSNSGYVKASSPLVSFPTFNISKLKISQVSGFEYELSDGTNTYTLDLNDYTGEFDLTGLTPSIGLIFDRMAQIGTTAVWKDWESCRNGKAVTHLFDSMFKDESKLKMVDTALNNYGIIEFYEEDEFSVHDGVVSLDRNSPLTGMWTYCLIDSLDVGLRLTYIDAYVILAVKTGGTDFQCLAIALSGSQKGKWCKFTRSSFTGSTVIPSFPTFNLSSIRITKTDSVTYHLDDGTNTFDLDISTQSLVDYSGMEKRLGLVCSHPFQVGMDVMAFTDYDDFETFKKIAEYVGTEVQTSSLRGKKIAVLGDSITANNLFTNALASISGCTILNYGISGSTISSVQNPFIDRVSGMSTDVDLVLVFGGVNDWQKGASLGSFAEENTQGNSTFYSALFGLMDALKNKYQNASIFKPIVFMTPIHCNYTGSPNKLEWSLVGGSLVENTYGGSVMSNYVKAIKEVAEFNALPVIDSHAISNLMPYNANNRTKYFQDGLHPNAAGASVLAKAVYDELIKFFN